MAFLFPAGAPLPEAPPCIRHRRFPRTGGNRHGLPLRVRAPHRLLGPAGDEAGCIYFALLAREHAGLGEEIESDLSRIIVGFEAWQLRIHLPRRPSRRALDKLCWSGGSQIFAGELAVSVDCGESGLSSIID